MEATSTITRRLIVGALLALWLICFALSVRAAIRGNAFSSINVTAAQSDDGYPVVTGFVPYLDGARSAIRIGDRLERIGDTTLQGAGPLEVWIAASAEGGTKDHVSVLYGRDEVRSVTELPLGSLTIFWPLLPASLIFAVTGGLLGFRGSGSPVSTAFSATFIGVAFLFASQFEGTRAEGYAAITVYFVAFSLNQPLWIRALQRFPRETAPSWWLARWGPWALLVLGPLDFSRIFGTPLSTWIGYRASFAGLAFTFALGFWILLRSYIVADAIGRRQLRIVLYGGYVAAFVPIAVLSLAAAAPQFSRIAFSGYLAVSAVPISLIIAITRYDLFDIDRLISVTATYNVLAVVLVATGFIVVPRTADAAAAFLNIDRSMSQLLVSSLLAIPSVPMSRVLRPWIDRLLFRERYAVDQGFHDLLAAVSAHGDASTLPSEVGDQLMSLLRPRGCVIYAGRNERFESVFAAARQGLPVFERTNPLVAALEARKQPIVTGARGRAGQVAELGPFERAALETLDAAVIVPMRYRARLVGFLCLGPKRSGDVYTPTDLALLTSVAEHLAIAFADVTTEEPTRVTSSTTGRRPAVAVDRSDDRARIGRYEIVAELGRGATGVVHAANDPTIGRRIALKVLPLDVDTTGGDDEGSQSTTERRFYREARAAGALLHPHIVTLYDAGVGPDCFYMAMEYVEGETFAAEIRRSGRVSVERTIAVGLSVAEALAYAHAAGLVHRDIKPGNLLVDRDGVVKVADFGIARFASSSATTVDGTFVGTPNYCSPEQLQMSDVDARADVFALGVVMYEAATGRHPFRGESLAATINAILSRDVEPPNSIVAEIPESLAAIIMRAVAKDREQRYQTAADLAAALRAVIGP